MTDKTKQAGFYLLDRYGLPTAILALVLWFVGLKVVDPLLQAHLVYLEKTAAAMQTVVKTEEVQVTALQQLTELVREQGKCLDEIKAGLGRPISRSTSTATTAIRPPGT
jgi:hypothetical protein